MSEKYRRRVDLRSMSLWFSPYPGNRVSFSRYSLIDLLPKSIFFQFFNPALVFFLTITIIELCSVPELSPRDSTLIPFCIMIGINVGKDLLIMLNEVKEERKFNNSYFEVWNGTGFSMMKSEDIIVGNYVKVYEKQKSPADLLVVFTNTFDGCFFSDLSEITGNCSLEKRHSVFECQQGIKNADEWIREKMVGDICFQEPSSNFFEFRGTLSIRKHPKLVQLDYKNLLLMSARLSGVAYVIGIVIYAGPESKLCLSIQKQSIKRNALSMKLSKLILSLLGLYLVLVFLCSTLTLYYFPQGQSFVPILVSYTLSFSDMVPVSLFFSYEIIRVLFSIFLYFKTNCKINLANINVVENLNKCSYFVTSTIGTLTVNTHEVTACVVKSKIFLRSINYFSLNGFENEGFSLFSNLDQDFSELKDCLRDETSLNYFKCLLLCNLKLENNAIGSYSKEESAIIAFGKEIGALIFSNNPKTVVLSISNELVACNIVNYHRGKNSRIIIENSSENWTVYVRGTEKKLLENLEIDPETKEKIYPKIESFRLSGVSVFVLGFRDLTQKEVRWVKKQINNANSFLEQKEKRLERMYRKLEKDCGFLGLCGIQDKVDKETERTVNLIKTKGKIWVASSDNKIGAMSACLKTGIFKQDSVMVYLRHIDSYSMCLRILADSIMKNVFLEDSSDNALEVCYKFSEYIELVSEVNSTIKPNLSLNSYNLLYEDPQLNPEIGILEDRIMKKIEASFELSQKFDVVIDRRTLRTALENPNTLKLLTCLLFAANSVCFYKLESKDKQDVVKIIKENLVNKPFVAAVGSREGDIPMIQAADVGISIVSDSTKLNYADIKVSSFTCLNKLFLNEGHNEYHKISKFVLLVLYKNLMLASFIFCHLFSNDFSYSLFDSFECFELSFNSWVVLPVITTSLEMNSRLKLKYQNCSFIEKQFNEISVFSVGLLVIHSITNGVIIYLFLFGVTPIIVLNDAGLTECNDLMTIMAFIIITNTFWIEVMRNLETLTVSFLTSLAVSVDFFLIFLCLLERNQESSYFSIVYVVKSCPVLVVHCILISLMGLICNTLIDSFIYQIVPYKRPNSKIYSKKLVSVYQNFSTTRQVIKDIYDTHPIFLKFIFNHIENIYKQNFINSNLKVIQITIIITTALYCSWTVIHPIFFDISAVYLFCKAGFSLLLIILSLSTFTPYFKSYYISLSHFVILFGLICKISMELIFASESIFITGLFPTMTYLFFNIDILKTSILNIFNMLGLITVKVVLSDAEVDSFEVSEAIIKIVLITLSSALLTRAIEITYRQEYKLIKIQEQNYEKTQRILCILLPNFIRKRVKDGVRYIAEDQGTVSVIFCDISDFDIICEEYSPTELLSFLDNFFQKLDDLCRAHGVSKIETVGKTYMACAGLKDSESEIDPSVKSIHHTKRSISFALAVLEETEKIVMKNSRKLEVKIGINSGPVVAGVVGYHKPQFALVGDTVNTASRMCTTLNYENRIQISFETFQMMPDSSNFKFIPSTATVKGKGEMSTFIVVPNIVEQTLMWDDFTSMKMAISGYQTERKSKNLGMLEMNFRTDIVFDKKCWKGGKLKESEEEKQVRINKMESNKEIFYPILMICLSSTSVEIVNCLYGLLYRKEENEVIILSLLLLSSGFIVFMIITFKKIYLKRRYQYLILLMVLVIICSFTSEQIISGIEKEDILLEYMFIILIFIYCSGFSAKTIVFLYPLIISSMLFLVFYPEFSIDKLLSFVCLTIFYIINTSVIFNRENQIVNYFTLKSTTENDLAKTENLLKQMMPAHVLDNLKNHKDLTEKLDSVTLLYSDIVGFTEWSSQRSPKEVVEVLSEVFSRFDKLCIKHNVYKVHTIGDCYVVLGNLDHMKRNPEIECLNVINMAFSMSEVLSEVNKEKGSNLSMRIGIHSGSIIAGIIGSDIVRYDIYGPDVLIAGKLESHSKPGRVNISESTKLLLLSLGVEGLSFEFNKEIDFFSIKRKLKSYFLDKVELY